ncbi:hypothetical protein D8S78_19085 [Natrialba swarupiae]|nr:hypothetical protein [Natrialba swarupiae]
MDREMIVHAVHPNRPRAIEPTDRAVLAGPELASERTVDVELVRMDLNSGSRAVRRLDGVALAAGDRR